MTLPEMTVTALTVEMTITRYKRRFWAVYDPSGALVCVCVYRKGAREVARRLSAPERTTG